MIWLLMTIFETILNFAAFFSSIFYLYLIYQANVLHSYCRIYLIILGIGMLFMTSYGLSIYEYLAAGQKFALLDEGVTFRSKTWEFIHEVGYALESMSMLFFSTERLIASKYPMQYNSEHFIVFIIFSLIISIGVALYFSTSIHVYGILYSPTAVASVLDLSALLIMIFAWHTSLRVYRQTTGEVGLNRRFQMSEVFEWTSTLLPAALGAMICKLLSSLAIWTWLILELTSSDYGVANFIYNNILNAYIVALPWIIVFRNRNLKRKYFSKSSPSSNNNNNEKIRTLEGDEIKLRGSQNDYFEMLRDSWKHYEV
ncbi:unnamed protein product [Caenorhabditis angaria]|uniref:Uncharacterized protein n=1 Tax=Caenorhabditis angaria TaxID=860376 RepID=A0A9P1N4M8_9PELO|nr:unnamed protein product [Caenorhabditis angaria]